MNDNCLSTDQTVAKYLDLAVCVTESSKELNILQKLGFTLLYSFLALALSLSVLLLYVND